jgi:hypothetical protein
MARTIYVEFSINVPDDADVFDVISSAEVSISGDSILSWELAHVCEDDTPIISNFKK